MVMTLFPNSYHACYKSDRNMSSWLDVYSKHQCGKADQELDQTCLMWLIYFNLFLPYNFTVILHLTFVKRWFYDLCLTWVY